MHKAVWHYWNLETKCHNPIKVKEQKLTESKQFIGVEIHLAVVWQLLVQLLQVHNPGN